MISTAVIFQLIWTSFTTSSYFVLFALAFALVLKVNRTFNFAQAAIMIASFYAAFASVSLAGAPGWCGFLAALAAAIVMALLIEIFGFRLLRRQRSEQMFIFIFTLIISEAVAYIAMLVFGTWPNTIFPSLYWPVTIISNVAISAWDVPAVGAMIGAIVGLFLFLRFARIGQFMTAIADNADLAELYGIDREKVHRTTMIVAALLIGIGMFLYGSRAQVQPTTSIDLMLFAIAATIIGGIGNLWGAAVTAIVLNIIENASVLIIPSEWQGFLLYVFLFLAIIVLPKGIKWPRRKRLAREVKMPDILAAEATET
jgi:branched-subunit amino acid ABC-type transport system permease component